MKYIHDSTQIFNDKECIVVLGNFDGVHIGHQRLLEEARNESKKNNIQLVVFSFYPPPTWVLSDKNKKQLIISREEKVKLMKEHEVDIFIEYPFNKEFAQITPQDFIKEILIYKLKAKIIVIGRNYNFGKEREGTADYLRIIGGQNNIDVKIVEEVKIHDKVVSSSCIREEILQGNIKLVNEMLGRNYSIVGKVVHGKKLGRTIGFPTANLETVNDMIYPPNGVYVTSVEVKNNTCIGITNIGINPTVSGNNKTIETNIFNFNQDIYDEYIRIKFYEYIRKEKKFEDINQLKSQIVVDSKYSQTFFGK